MRSLPSCTGCGKGGRTGTMIPGTLDSSSREESPVKRALDLLLGLTAFGLLLLSAARPLTASAEVPDKTAVSRTAEIDGVRFHYLTAGHGAPVILLHGYAETSLMWRPIIPLLAKRFAVIGPTPEALVKGRERTYFEHFWNDFAADKARSIPEADRKTYTAAYSRPGRMRAGWAYFVSFPQAAKDFAELSQTKLPMPLLVIGGEKALGEVLGEQAKLVASDVTVNVLKDTGHWVLEERPKETTDALEEFL